MKHPLQLELTDPTRAATVDCIGSELFIVLAQLQQQGAVVEVLSTIPGRRGAWRLSLRWPKSLTITGYHRPQENYYPSAHAGDHPSRPIPVKSTKKLSFRLFTN
jgi:hypothetical protein